MKDIRLLGTTIIGGVPRSPIEGIQTVSDEEADRLIAAGQAQDAADDVDREDDDGDNLDKNTVVQLRKIAKDEGVTIEGDANKATILAAIRQHRLQPTQAPIALDGLDEAQLREIAATESITLAEGSDTDAVRAAIIEHRTAQT